MKPLKSAASRQTPTQRSARVTSARVASFDVAGDADHCQCVDAAQTEHQREEAVHLEETDAKRYGCVLVQAPPPKCMLAPTRRDLSRPCGMGCVSGVSQVYLAGPDRGDEIATVLEDVEDLDDASGVAEDGDAGVGDGEVKGQVVGGLQGGSLSVQDEEDDAVSEPRQPP